MLTILEAQDQCSLWDKKVKCLCQYKKPYPTAFYPLFPKFKPTAKYNYKRDA